MRMSPQIDEMMPFEERAAPVLSNFVVYSAITALLVVFWLLVVLAIF